MECFSQSNIGIEDAQRLRDTVLIVDQRLGSSSFEYIFDQFDSDLYSILFDGHSKNLYETADSRPSIILGRRGSGKSTYLNHLSKKENVLPIGLKIWDLIDLVEEQVKVIIDRQGVIDAEKCSDIWHLIFMTFVAVETAQLTTKNGLVVEFVKSLPIAEITKTSLTEIASIIITKIKKTYLDSESNFNIELCLKALSVSSDIASKIEGSLSNTLLSQGKKAILLLDNPERFVSDKKHLEHISITSRDASREATLAGLLNLIGRLNKGHQGIQVRLCIPSEQYSYMKCISQARKKDFGNMQILHWTSGELLSMTAHRYLVFLTVYKDLRDNMEFSELASIPIYTREGAIKFWNSILYQQLPNGNANERVLTYLLRHTQLVPRQILDFLNKAISIEIAGGSNNLCKLSASSIKEAVHECVYDCSSEIIDSFSYAYPEGMEIFEDVLPNLPVMTTAQQLTEILYKTSGAKGVLQKYSGHPQVTVTKARFLRMLVETGIYGKVISGPKHRSNGYINAEYEYTISGCLRVCESDKMAMHPIFSINLSNTYIDDTALGVYPSGTDCEDLDYK